MFKGLELQTRERRKVKQDQWRARGGGSSRGLLQGRDHEPSALITKSLMRLNAIHDLAQGRIWFLFQFFRPMPALSLVYEQVSMVWLDRWKQGLFGYFGG